MKSRMFFTAKEWLNFYFSAKTFHEVDSPFISAFCNQVLEKKEEVNAYKKIESLRQDLLSDHSTIKRTDFGAGSIITRSSHPEILVSEFVQSSAITKKNGKLLHRITRFCKPNLILELGTALGISAAYMKATDPDTTLITIEGDPVVAKKARSNFERLLLPGIEVIEGKFETVLPHLLNDIESVDLLFIDGHHRGTALLNYLEILYPKLNPQKGIVVIDDIHWNQDMASAWNKLKNQPEWPILIDLFQFGILILNPDILIPARIQLVPSKYKPWSLGLFR